MSTKDLQEMDYVTPTEMFEIMKAQSQRLETRLDLHYAIQDIITKNPTCNFEVPSEFHQVARTSEQLIGDLFQWIFLIKLDTLRFLQIRFVFLQYDFVNNHLVRLVEQIEGSELKQEKSTWLINSFVPYILDKKIPEDILIKGDVVVWYSFIDSLREFYFGFPARYLREREVLLNSYSG